MAQPARPRGAGLRSSRSRPAPALLPGRTPPHPGQFLESRFLRPLAISQTELAQALGVSRRRINELVNGRRGITPDTAVRLAVYFRNDAAFWMHLQVAWDMRGAVKKALRGRSAKKAVG